MSVFSDNELTCDAFLGGRLQLFQPRKGYRAGVDPVLLAASVPATSGQSVLELGCGAGAAALCLGTRVPHLNLTGVEVQETYADLARRNAGLNDMAMTVVQGDLLELPNPVRQQQFDHVIANPPYYRKGAHSAARDTGRSIALGEQTPLVDWVDIAARRLGPKGVMHMIQRADRLPEMLGACDARLGSLEVLPLAPRDGRAPELVILRARKGGRADFRLHAPVILHAGKVHDQGNNNYTPEITDVLRNGAALKWSKDV